MHTLPSIRLLDLRRVSGVRMPAHFQGPGKIGYLMHLKIQQESGFDCDGVNQVFQAVAKDVMARLRDTQESSAAPSAGGGTGLPLRQPASARPPAKKSSCCS